MNPVYFLIIAILHVFLIIIREYQKIKIMHSKQINQVTQISATQIEEGWSLFDVDEEICITDWYKHCDWQSDTTWDTEEYTS